jgi:hypothetical protein
LFAQPLAGDMTPSSAHQKHDDLSNVDTLARWRYRFVKTSQEKSATPTELGKISFYRTRALDDSISVKIYHQKWSPGMSYSVFNLSDSTYCIKMANHTRVYSSCVPPDVGGDYFVLGKYIFVNLSVCLNCRKHDSGIDYCRPLVNYVISKVDKNKAATLDEIFSQFVIDREK